MAIRDDSQSEHVRGAVYQESGFDENEATVLGSASALKAEEFPEGLTPRELAHALDGEMLNHFLLQKFIGGGGMGVVFKAHDTTLDRIVAVKILATHAIKQKDLHRRFMVEAQSTARLDHPNIARVHLVGQDRGLAYIVFEFIDGVNIRDLVANHGPIPVGDAISFTYQIGHALAQAWQREVVHRDIKPSNILVTREGQAKLVDMGLARLYQENTTDGDLTSTGMTLGTFDYISPEQARDARVADTRSDIYSLGCTLFYMLAARPPFAKGTAVEKLLQHQGDQAPSIRSVRPELPESVDKLLQRMLAKQPADRPQTPSELVGELGGILKELGLPLPQSLAPLPITKIKRKTEAWRKHLPWVAPLVVMLIVSAWLIANNDRNDEDFEFPASRTQQETPAKEVAPSGNSSAETSSAEQPNSPESVTSLPADMSPSNDSSASTELQEEENEKEEKIELQLGESYLDPETTSDEDAAADLKNAIENQAFESGLPEALEVKPLYPGELAPDSNDLHSPE